MTITKIRQNFSYFSGNQCKNGAKKERANKNIPYYALLSALIVSLSSKILALYSR